MTDLRARVIAILSASARWLTSDQIAKKLNRNEPRLALEVGKQCAYLTRLGKVENKIMNGMNHWQWNPVQREQHCNYREGM